MFNEHGIEKAVLMPWATLKLECFICGAKLVTEEEVRAHIQHHHGVQLDWFKQVSLSRQ